MFVRQISYLFCSETKKSLLDTFNVTISASCLEVKKIATSAFCVYFEIVLGWLILFSISWNSSVVCGTPLSLRRPLMTISAALVSDSGSHF